MKINTNSKQKKSFQQQLLFDKKDFKSQKEFGGSLLKKSNPKTARPISTKNAMHLTLRSSKAKGQHSFLASRQRVQQIENTIYSVATKCSVKIYRYANVGNHLHLLVKATNRSGFIRFLRSVTGIITRIVLGKERGRSQNSKCKASCNQEGDQEKFWDKRPWTRIIAWMKDFENVVKYIKQNYEEAAGLTPYKPRKYSLRG